MMKTRCKTAVLLILAAIPLLYYSGEPYVASGFAAVLSCLEIREVYRVYRKELCSLPGIFTIFFAFYFAFTELSWYRVALETVFPVILLVFLVLMLKGAPLRHGVAFYPFLLGVLISFFNASLMYIGQQEHGRELLLMLVLNVVCADVAAYFTGKATGSHKLAPNISPGKTMEGALGGIVAATVVCLFLSSCMGALSDFHVNYTVVILYAITTAVVGQIGDLAMSLIKRRNDVKDFGTLLPGHGGVLDRFDSLLFSAPHTLIFITTFTSERIQCYFM